MLIRKQKLKLEKTEVKDISIFLPEWYDYKWWREFTQKHFKYRFRDYKYYYLTASILYRSQNSALKNKGISMPLAAMSEKWEISRLTLGKIISALESDGYIVKVRNHNRYKKIAREWRYNYDISNLKKLHIFSPVWNQYNNNAVKKISEDNIKFQPKYFNYINNLDKWWFPISSFKKIDKIDWSKTSEGRIRSPQEVFNYKNMIKLRMNSWNSGDRNIKLSDKCGRLFHTPNEINKKARILYRHKGNNQSPVEVDINAAHLRILIAMILDLELDIEKEVLELINNNDIYSFISNNVKRERDYVKLSINSKLINTHKLSDRWIVNKFISKKWPLFWESISYIQKHIKSNENIVIANKQYNAQNLGALCMLVESEIVLKTCDYLAEHNAPVLSIHDAILTLPNYVNNISENLINSWNKYWNSSTVILRTSTKYKAEKEEKETKVTFNTYNYKIYNDILVEPKIKNIEALSNSPP